MQLVLLFFVLIISAPLIVFGSPIILYVVPFIVVGLALSLMADSVRDHLKEEQH